MSSSPRLAGIHHTLSPALPALLVLAGMALPPLSGLAQVTQPPRDRDRDAGRERAPAAQRDERERGVEDLRVRPAPGRARWTLGITATDTETGVRVTRVISRSAADRAGLERGDLIITVNGYQIGIVQGRRYELSEELERRADRRGRVRLLVQKRRNGTVQNLDVRLDPRSGADTTPETDPDSPVDRATLTGRAILNPPDIPLPFNATLTVQMFVLGGQGQPGQLIAQNVIQQPGMGPIPFALRFDPTRIPPGGQAGLVAEIAVNGQILFQTPGVQRIGRPGEGPADIMLQPVR
jgi:uncharacterized lipoprotein YbaY